MYPDFVDTQYSTKCKLSFNFAFFVLLCCLQHQCLVFVQIGKWVNALTDSVFDTGDIIGQATKVLFLIVMF